MLLTKKNPEKTKQPPDKKISWLFDMIATRVSAGNSAKGQDEG